MIPACFAPTILAYWGKPNNGVIMRYLLFLTIGHFFSEDYLRAQLMRSTSDEAVNSKSEDLDADVDSIRGGGGGGGKGGAGSPGLYHKPRPLRFPALSLAILG